MCDVAAEYALERRNLKASMFAGRHDRRSPRARLNPALGSKLIQCALSRSRRNVPLVMTTGGLRSVLTSECGSGAETVASCRASKRIFRGPG